GSMRLFHHRRQPIVTRQGGLARDLVNVAFHDVHGPVHTEQLAAGCEVANVCPRWVTIRRLVDDLDVPTLDPRLDQSLPTHAMPLACNAARPERWYSATPQSTDSLRPTKS